MDNNEYKRKSYSFKIHKKKGWAKRLDKSGKIGLSVILTALSLVLVISILFFAAPGLLGKPDKKATITTISTLEKIINISELSTFQAIYNGIAKVMNDSKPNEIDYYVSYKAKVNAGFDFDKVKIDLNEKLKKITLIIPEIKITGVTVDSTSLECMFVNDKANKSGVMEYALKACDRDVTEESENESAIFELAEENAKNVMKALINPYIEQLYSEYELEIKVGGV